ncbi:MAG: hypothetical protein V3S01_02760 [Dehalococcoidia bacterium]
MNANRWRRVAVVALGLIVAPALTACSAVLHGTWKTDPVPEDESFYIIQAEFDDQGTFRATAKREGEVVRLAGAYDYNGFTLRIRRPGKPDREYPATYLLGGKLRLRSGDKKLTMKKQ